MKDWKTTLTGFIGGAAVITKGLIIAYNTGQFTGETGWHLAGGIAFFVLGLLTADSKTTVAE